MTAGLKRYFVNIRDRDVMLILVGVAIFVVGFSLGAHFKSGSPNLWAWADSFFQNFGTEMFGAFLTFLLIEVLVGARRDRQRLIRQLGSRVNEEAVRAAEELRAAGWLEDGSLRGADLEWANLQGAYLQGADLEHLMWGKAEFNEDTALPDDTKWTSETDMIRFTDPEHPDFWRSDVKWSPAYRGNDDNDDD